MPAEEILWHAAIALVENDCAAVVRKFDIARAPSKKLWRVTLILTDLFKQPEVEVLAKDYPYLITENI